MATPIEQFTAMVRNKTLSVIGIGVSNTPLIKMLLRSGIRVTAELLRSGKIVICPACGDLLREIELYRWDERAGRDQPVKRDDHAMDDLRYFVMYCEQEEKPGGFCAARVERTRR